MSKFLNDFKAFALRGNVVDMAVGVIVGAAFGKIVSSLVNDLLMPAIGLFVGGVNFSELAVTLKQAVIVDGVETAPAVMLRYGAFIQVVIDFAILAFCVFLLIKGISKLQNMKAKKEEAPAPAPEPPKPSKEEELLTEIRDLLKTK